MAERPAQKSLLAEVRLKVMVSYPAKAYEPLKALGMAYDFHLAHGIQSPEYSKDWRLFHPPIMKI